MSNPIRPTSTAVRPVRPTDTVPMPALRPVPAIFISDYARTGLLAGAVDVDPAARAAELLAQGATLTEIADQLGVDRGEATRLAMRASDDEQTRPYWLTGPCPAWCEVDGWHSADAQPADRSHIAAAYADPELPLTLMPASAHGSPQRAWATLHQHVDWARPRISLNAGSTEVELTIDEAQAIADQLATLVRLARGEVTR